MEESCQFLPFLLGGGQQGCPGSVLDEREVDTRCEFHDLEAIRCDVDHGKVAVDPVDDGLSRDGK